MQKCEASIFDYLHCCVKARITILIKVSFEKKYSRVCPALALIDVLKLFIDLET